MGWVSKLFSKVGVNLVGTVGKVLDDLFTSDEELALNETQKAKVKAALEIRMQELLVELDKQSSEHEENLEKELTERAALDMKSDSWLSKNIRPLALTFMTVVVSILAIFTIFDDGLTKEQLAALEAWTPFFQTIMVTIYAFYFGSRGLEKVQKIRSAGQTEIERQGRLSRGADQEPKG